MANIIRKEFLGLEINVLSVGKHKDDPSLNEDGWIVTENTFAVIDGSAPRVDLKFDGKSSARFATDIIKNVLLATPPNINGKELVLEITSVLNEEIDKIGFREIVKKNKEATPAALFTSARIVGNKVVITALGDVYCRINGKVIHCDRFESEDLMIAKRISAMKNAKNKNPSILDEELIQIGHQAIMQDLIYQVSNYFNKADIDLGLGIIDGNKVPEKFIKKYAYDLKNIKTLELFSDGYHVLPHSSSINSWEKKFFEGEKEDPLRWRKYPSVKAASKNMFSDDRTIVIVKRLL